MSLPMRSYIGQLIINMNNPQKKRKREKGKKEKVKKILQLQWRNALFRKIFFIME